MELNREQAVVHGRAQLRLSTVQRAAAIALVGALACNSFGGIAKLVGAGEAAVAVGAGAAVVMGGPLIADFVEREKVRRVIPAGTAAEFALYCGATVDQRDAAANLVQGAQTELSTVISTHLRKVRDGIGYEQLLASEAGVMTRARAIEAQLLEDLRAVTTAEQAAGWAAFERSHRRALLIGVGELVIPFDLFAFLREGGFGFRADAELAEVMERFDVEQDDALIGLRIASREYVADIRGRYDGSDEAVVIRKRIIKELNAARSRLGRIQATVLQRVLPRLSVQLREKLVVALLEDRDRGLGMRGGKPERLPVVREVLALRLSAEQRAEVAQLVEGAKRATLEAGAKYLSECIADELDPGRRKDRQNADEPMNVFYASADKIKERIKADMLALLAPEQRRAYEASPVVEPSEVSPIGGE